MTGPNKTQLLFAVQVQECPRDVFDDKACVILEKLSFQMHRALSTPRCGMWAGHLSSLDFIPLLHDHLRAVEAFVAIDDPSELAAKRILHIEQAAAAATPPVSSSSAADSGMSATQIVLSYSLFHISQLLAMFISCLSRSLAVNCYSQESQRAVLQLLHGPDPPLSLLVSLVLTPAMREQLATADGLHTYSEGAAGAIDNLVDLLGHFYHALCYVPRALDPADCVVWERLHSKLSAMLTSGQALPYLEHLLFPPTRQASTPLGHTYPALHRIACYTGF